jgi:hypothetical protein
MDKLKDEKKEVVTNDDIIKKTSLDFFLLVKEIESAIESTEAKKITEKINKIDKDLLKHFDVKLSQKDKESAFNLMKLWKK